MRRTVTGCLYVACHSWKDCWENEGWLEALTIWGHRLFPPVAKGMKEVPAEWSGYIYPTNPGAKGEGREMEAGNQ